MFGTNTIREFQVGIFRIIKKVHLTTFLQYSLVKHPTRLKIIGVYLISSWISTPWSYIFTKNRMPQALSQFPKTFCTFYEIRNSFFSYIFHELFWVETPHFFTWVYHWVIAKSFLPHLAKNNENTHRKSKGFEWVCVPFNYWKGGWKCGQHLCFTSIILPQKYDVNSSWLN